MKTALLFSAALLAMAATVPALWVGAFWARSLGFDLITGSLALGAPAFACMALGGWLFSLAEDAHIAQSIA